MKQVIHIFGASGSGTSTLGRALAQRLNLRFMDTDDYYWQKTDPPFTVKRDISERISMMLKDLEESDGAVCSGSLGGWGDRLIDYFTLAVRIETPTDIRIRRLREREYRNFGERIREGGDMFEEYVNFIEWASKYDNDDDSVRNRYKHDRWQKKLKCPLIMIDGTKSVEEEAEEVLREMEKISSDDLRKYDGRPVRITTVEGVIFEGRCGYSSAESDLEQLEKEEEGLEIDGWVFLRSDIRSVEEIEEKEEYIWHDRREHLMNLDPDVFDMIESGRKTIELRLYDEKRQKLRKGDIIRFQSRADEDDVLRAEVIDLMIYDSFRELYEELPLLQCGYTEQNVAQASWKDMGKYYSVQKQAEYKALGILIKCLPN